MSDLTGFIFEGLLSVIFGTFGFIGNVTAIIYFGKQRSRLRTFQKLLQVLAIFDIIFIICTILVLTIPKFYEDYDYTGFPMGSVFFLQPYILPSSIMTPASKMHVKKQKRLSSCERNIFRKKL